MIDILDILFITAYGCLNLLLNILICKYDQLFKQEMIGRVSIFLYFAW